jgi:hypothetical protein
VGHLVTKLAAKSLALLAAVNEAGGPSGVVSRMSIKKGGYLNSDVGHHAAAVSTEGSRAGTAGKRVFDGGAARRKLRVRDAGTATTSCRLTSPQRRRDAISSGSFAHAARGFRQAAMPVPSVR